MADRSREKKEKAGSSKTDALRTERERKAAEREARAERQAKCRHPRTEPKMEGFSVCLLCGAVVERSAP